MTNLDQYTTTQPIADLLKCHLLALPRSPGRIAALAAIARLETYGWHARAFADALADGDLLIADGRLTYPGDRPFADYVIALIDDYADRISAASSAPAGPDDLLPTAEAAAYLGMTTGAFKNHVYRDQRIAGTLIGRTVMFRRANLDALRAGTTAPPAEAATRPDDLLSAADAARYLGISLPTLKHYVYKRPLLSGHLHGRSLMFRRADLDAFRPVLEQIRADAAADHATRATARHARRRQTLPE